MAEYSQPANPPPFDARSPALEGDAAGRLRPSGDRTVGWTRPAAAAAYRRE